MLPPKLLEAQENRLSVCFNLLGVFVSICWCVWISSLALYGEAYYQGSLILVILFNLVKITS